MSRRVYTGERKKAAAASVTSASLPQSWLFQPQPPCVDILMAEDSYRPLSRVYGISPWVVVFQFMVIMVVREWQWMR